MKMKPTLQDDNRLSSACVARSDTSPGSLEPPSRAASPPAAAASNSETTG